MSALFFSRRQLFYLRLSDDGVVHVAKGFVVHKAMDAVGAREAVGFSGFVPEDAGDQESDDAHVRTRLMLART
jgi:hypothetical protein